MTDNTTPPEMATDDPMPLRGGTCATHGDFNNLSGRCLNPACAHEPGYEEIDDGFVVVRCLCHRFYRIFENQDVAEAEYRNHVDLAGGAS
jgi:hypothetical protein